MIIIGTRVGADSLEKAKAVGFVNTDDQVHRFFAVILEIRFVQ
jgi:hypothetical protein